MGLFGSIFKKKSNLQDYSAIGVDMHSHLIPGIDDGSKSLEDSINLIRGLKGMGFNKIITTPHIMAGGYDNSPETILPGLDKIREELQSRDIGVEIKAAAEYYYDEHFTALVKKGELMTLGDNYVLFELSFLSEPQGVEYIIFEMLSKGFKPILAHPERYPFYYSKDLDKYKELKERGVYLQMNIASLVGLYSKRAADIAKKMIDEELIDFIGTDLHSEKHLGFMRRTLEEPYLEKLINSGKLMNNKLFS